MILLMFFPLFQPVPTFLGVPRSAPEDEREDGPEDGPDDGRDIGRAGVSLAKKVGTVGTVGTNLSNQWLGCSNLVFQPRVPTSVEAF
jgi:hypothetical protein